MNHNAIACRAAFNGDHNVGDCSITRHHLRPKTSQRSHRSAPRVQLESICGLAPVVPYQHRAKASLDPGSRTSKGPQTKVWKGSKNPTSARGCPPTPFAPALPSATALLSTAGTGQRSPRAHGSAKTAKTTRGAMICSSRSGIRAEEKGIPRRAHVNAVHAWGSVPAIHRTRAIMIGVNNSDPDDVQGGPSRSRAVYTPKSPKGGCLDRQTRARYVHSPTPHPGAC